MAKYVINTENKKSKINKEIYGHFSEHLGRCIYEGLYVGENSDIPNIERDAKRCSRGAQGDEDSGTSLAGRMFCR